MATHPSTLGAALLAYGATGAQDRRAALSIAAVFGDGSHGTHDHRLDTDELLTRVTLPAPVSGEHAAYFRATSRVRRVAARRSGGTPTDRDGGGDENGTVTWAGIAVGAVAPIPLRLPRVEAALVGQPITAAAFAVAAAHAVEGANRLPMTGRKADLLVGTVT